MIFQLDFLPNFLYCIEKSENLHGFYSIQTFKASFFFSRPLVFNSILYIYDVQKNGSDLNLLSLYPFLLPYTNPIKIQWISKF